jgi:succinate dehydrogenase / fumarate reductase iron-sulfur subunit
MAEGKQVIIKVKRQASPKEAARWEEFALPWRASMNVIICLRDIAENPVTREGKQTTPVSYDSNCLEEVCGSCAMLIRGKATVD